MSRRKDRTKSQQEFIDGLPEVEVKLYPGPTAEDDARDLPAMYEQVRQERRASQNAAALQGLTDDSAGRVAEAVYAQVFAATWVKRQDLTGLRRRKAAADEAGFAGRAAWEEWTAAQTPPAAGVP